MLLLGAAAAAGYVGMQFRDGVPVIDSSYASPATPPATPGELIRSEPYEGDLPEGMHAFRIAYSTTGSEGAPALASAVVAVSAQAQAPAPVIAWAHGTVGVARSCAPSLGPDAISEAGMPALEEIVARGWAVVATDYTGMGMAGDFPYLIGTDDEVIPVVHSRDYLSLLCAAASSVEAHFYEGRTHMSVLAEDSALPADLIAWTSARFAGRSSSVDSCP